MSSKKIYALGVGRNTSVFIDFAISCGYEVSGLYHYNDEKTGKFDHGYKILGSFEELFAKQSLFGMNFLLTMGDINIRAELSNKLIAKGGNVPTLIHPMACVSTFAKISNIGVCVFPFSYIQSDSSIDDNTVVLSHVNVSHTTHIGKNCFIAGGALVGAFSQVEDFVFIGQGAIVISSKVGRIGEHAYIGAGSVITKPVESNSVVAGVPAHIISKHSK